MNKTDNNGELHHGHNVNWYVVTIYRTLINKLESMKIGDRTEFNTVVSQGMIDTIKKRYEQLCKESSYNGIEWLS